tara:strand:- start:12984 stop:13598 length:615 start_codon:yes stop_codon:yes gene_type:complete
MKLSDYAALQIGAEILEEFEEIETAKEEKDFHDIPDDYCEDEDEDVDDSKWSYSQAESNLKKEWSWYTKSVPPAIVKLLKEIREESFFNLGHLDRVVSDCYARCFYELYTAPRLPEEFLKYVTHEYFKLVDMATPKDKMAMVQIWPEDYLDENGFMEHLTWCLVRNITHPMSEIFGWELERLDQYYLQLLIEEAHENASSNEEY